MQTRLITTDDELSALEGSWNSLVRSRPETDAPFYSWDWFWYSWRHFGKPKKRELAVVSVEDEGRLQGILPLTLVSKKTSAIRYRSLEFCNVGMTPRNTAYCDASADPDAVFRAMRDALFSERKRWDMIELSNVPETSAFHRFWLERSKDASSATIRLRGFIAPHIPLEGSLDDYYEMLGRGTRRDMRRRLRIFKDRGDAAKVRFFERPDEMSEGLELLFEVHRRSWKGEFLDPHYPEFYREITAALSLRSEVLIAVASVDDTPISAGYVLQNGETYFSLVNDHDMRFRDLAPGTVLFLYELDRLLKTGRRCFDFCGTSYDYKERLSQGSLAHSTFQTFHGGAKSGFLFSAKTFWLPMLRKLLRKPLPDDLISVERNF